MIKAPDTAVPASFLRRIAAMTYDVLLLLAVLFAATFVALILRSGEAFAAHDFWFSAYLVLVSFFQNIPRDLENAAMIDGCSRLGTLWRIVLPQCNIDVFMGLLVVMIPTDHDVFVGNIQINPDLVQIPLMLMMVLGFDRYPATRNLVAESFQFGCFFPDSGLYCVGMGNAAEYDF